jgi:hypothetical protein
VGEDHKPKGRPSAKPLKTRGDTDAISGNRVPDTSWKAPGTRLLHGGHDYFTSDASRFFLIKELPTPDLIPRRAE